MINIKEAKQKTKELWNKIKTEIEKGIEEKEIELGKIDNVLSELALVNQFEKFGEKK